MLPQQRTFEQLVALAERPSPADEAALPADERRTVERVRATLAALRDDASVAPPPAVRARALRLMRQQTIQQPAQPGFFAQLVASLSFDSLTAAATSGVRGSTATPRQLLFAVGSFEIDIQVLAQGAQLRLLGQVLSRGEDAVVGEVLLFQHAREIASTPLDELGEFSFDALAPGSYALRVRMPAAEIGIPEVQLLT
jgi:hypothetical protein